MQKLFSLLALLFSYLFCQAQDNIKKDSLQQKILFKGLFQGQYIISLTKNVDVLGLHHLDGKAVYNSFDVKRARAQFTARISDRTEAVLALNLADFKTDPKNKVLENAYLTYRLNSFLHFKIGQFRPVFGLEDTYPIDVIKSFDYSNQYNSFGDNGWQSFQIGLSIYGEIKSDLPMQYELTVVNGNNKNQITDDDNGKQFTLRTQFNLVKRLNLKLGINGGAGRHKMENVYAYGIDLSAIFPLWQKFSFEFEAEWKEGNNHFLYYSLDSSLRIGKVNQYQMHGFYILPNLRYAIAYHRLSSIEFSCRYEYFDADYKHQINPRQTITPMIGLEFLKEYNARIQIGMTADIYRQNIAGTKQYNSQLFILQVQSRL